MNRQKSRGIVENVLSGMKAGFKSILNYEHPFERKKMDHQKSKSTFSAILLTLTLMVAAFGVSSTAMAAKQMVIDPGTGKLIVAPQYGGTLTYALTPFINHTDSFLSHGAGLNVSPVLDRIGISNWAIVREKVA